MKKYFLFFIFCTLAISSFAQTRGVKIGYIDMDYILENVPDYKEASIQLEQKAQKWKEDLEVKKNEIKRLEELLKTERALLTKELIVEREDEIKFLQDDLIDYQQKRFGTKGDYIIQKTTLVKPIQDQVFTAAQDLAAARGYDFIFDKSSDLTILFAAKKYDLSELIVKTIVRAEKREQVSKKQQKLIEEKEKAIDKKDEEENPELVERNNLKEQRKKEREDLINRRKEEIELKKKEFEERRKKIIEARSKKKTGTTIDSTATNKIDERIIENDSIKKQ